MLVRDIFGKMLGHPTVEKKLRPITREKSRENSEGRSQFQGGRLRRRPGVWTTRSSNLEQARQIYAFPRHLGKPEMKPIITFSEMWRAPVRPRVRPVGPPSGAPMRDPVSVYAYTGCEGWSTQGGHLMRVSTFRVAEEGRSKLWRADSFLSASHWVLDPRHKYLREHFGYWFYKH